MKMFFLLAFIVCWAASTPCLAQETPGSLHGLPPGYMEQMKKMLPPGAQFPTEIDGEDGSGRSLKPKPLIELPPVQETEYKPLPSSANTPSTYGSGRTPEQRAAAIAAINVELDAMPYKLPFKQAAPSRSDILKLAKDLHTAARNSFGPKDVSAYTNTVIWIPRFDGINPDPEKARLYSILVSAATNYFSQPHYIVALATAVFSLDPESIANANNLASAIVSAAERQSSDPAVLSSGRRQAEMVYLYALALEKEAWREQSFTAILNLANLYLDMGRPDEARSLFQVARKLKPFSWDAALGMAAYFYAVGKPDKALAVLEDDNLDRPVIMIAARRSARLLEKSDSFADVSLDSPEALYEEGIKVMSSEPIATAADFIAQMDQSTRNKMRYFIENLPPKGSFTAPSITKISQYTTLNAISSPQGVSALNEFGDMLAGYELSSASAGMKQQIEFLARMGLNIDPGVDLDDVARHPGKYEESNIEPKISGKEQFKANLKAMARQSKSAQQDLKGGNVDSTIGLVSSIDPFFTILQINPEKYADPMNVVIQKHNLAVHSRKTNLYRGYLFTVNKRTYQSVSDIINAYYTQVEPLEQQMESELEKVKEQAAGLEDAESKLMIHAVHKKYFMIYNELSRSAFASTTNVASAAYVQKIKPVAEAFYYDVIRHVALISDPDIRSQKDLELRKSVNEALVWGLKTALMAHGSFSNSDDWDCDCDIEALVRQRAREQKALDAAENNRIAKNKAAKAVFDSGEIPESSPLFKKLDAYGTDLNIPFIPFLSGRISCARTVVTINTNVLPIPGVPELFGSMTRSEFTGAAKYDAGVTIGFSKEAGAGSVDANFGLSGSVSTDGDWNVRDYSVTPSTSLSVQTGNVEVSVGGKMTFGPNGLQDSDFSAGISKDVKTGFGISGKGFLEVSTKRGVTPPSGEIGNSVMQQAQEVIDTWHVKEIWSGKFEI